MFIRFIVPKQNRDSHTFAGLFQAAYELRDGTTLDESETAVIQEVLRWFHVNLPVPKCLKVPENARAVSWFNSQAKEPLTEMWRLVGVLKTYGVPVRVLKTADPGTIIYSDKWQVVAKPHKSMRIRRRL